MIICLWCGEPIPGAKDPARRYHRQCARKVNNRRSGRAARLHWKQYKEKQAEKKAVLASMCGMAADQHDNVSAREAREALDQMFCQAAVVAATLGPSERWAYVQRVGAALRRVRRGQDCSSPPVRPPDGVRSPGGNL